MSLIGKQIPEFKAQAYHNYDLVDITEKDVKGHWSLVVFYPADFTFVCPTELAELADLYSKFQAVGCEVYSVSTDTAFVHLAWAQSSPSIKKVNYPMIGDPNGQLSRFFEVMVEESGQALRGSFILDPEGVIQSYEVSGMSVGRNMEEALRKVQACQYVAEHGSQGCPAKWVPGESGINTTTDLVGKI